MSYIVSHVTSVRTTVLVVLPLWRDAIAMSVAVPATADTVVCALKISGVACHSSVTSHHIAWHGRTRQDTA